MNFTSVSERCNPAYYLGRKNLPMLVWKLCICLIFIGLSIQPAVPLSFFFSSEDLVGCVLLDFT